MSILLNEIMRIQRLERDAEHQQVDDDLNDEENFDDAESDEDLDDEEDLDGEEGSGSDTDREESIFASLFADETDEDDASDEDDLDLDDLDLDDVDDEDLGYGGDEDEYGNAIVFDDDERSGAFEDDEFTELEDDPNAPKQPNSQQDDQQGQIQFDDGELDSTDDMQEDEPEDPNHAGVIRHVKGAHLVYKREEEDGTYTEMWIYNSGKFKNDLEVKKAILAGTDIPKGAAQSPDGSQEATMWSSGNATVVVVTGLQQ